MTIKILFLYFPFADIVIFMRVFCFLFFFLFSANKVENLVANMLGNRLVTKQTPKEGVVVNKVRGIYFVLLIAFIGVNYFSAYIFKIMYLPMVGKYIISSSLLFSITYNYSTCLCL